MSRPGNAGMSLEVFWDAPLITEIFKEFLWIFNATLHLSRWDIIWHVVLVVNVYFEVIASEGRVVGISLAPFAPVSQQTFYLHSLRIRHDTSERLFCQYSGCYYAKVCPLWITCWKLRDSFLLCPKKKFLSFWWCTFVLNWVFSEGKKTKKCFFLLCAGMCSKVKGLKCIYPSRA